MPPKPILHVDEAGLPESVTKAIENLNAGSSPTALQAQCWPVVLSGRDLVAVDYTASKGKPLAYLVPALGHVQHQPVVLAGGGPTVLVLTATREMAQQVLVAVRKLTEGTNIRTMYLVSGDPKPPQLKQLQEGADICIATPGRLQTFMEEHKVNLSRCTFLAIDEAGRMMAMGLGQNLRTIVDNVRPDRQTIVRLACATRESRELAEEFTKDAINVSVGIATLHKSHRVEHVVFVCEEAEKEHKLVALLNDIIEDDNDTDRRICREEANRRRPRGDLVRSGLADRRHSRQDVEARTPEGFKRLATRQGYRPGGDRHGIDGHGARQRALRGQLRLPEQPGRISASLQARGSARRDGQEIHVSWHRTMVYMPGSWMWFLRENKQPLPPPLRKLANKAARK
ncbi:hypothetical protein MTO96_035536 [Rhipicephalus appendiculatus]